MNASRFLNKIDEFITVDAYAAAVRHFFVNHKVELGMMLFGIVRSYSVWFLSEKSVAMNKRVLGILLVTSLLSVFMEVIVTDARIQAVDSVNEHAFDDVRSFRLLAVEGIAGFSTETRSGQYLIKELLRYPNWDNRTQKFVSYVHLLSNFAYDEVSDVAKPFFVGDLTKESLRSEIVDFLGGAAPNETVVFYYSGNGEELGLTLGKYPDSEVVNSTELVSWLGSVGLSKASVCIFLDTCYSGSWINDGLDSGGVLGSGRLVLAACRVIS